MKRFLVACAFVLFARAMLGQTNTNNGQAATYMWGQKATSTVKGTPPTEFWFLLEAVQGRCYCVEAINFEGAYGDKILDTELTVYQDDAFTVIKNNNNTNEEPFGTVLSRACWIHNLPDQDVFVKLFPHDAGVPNSQVTLRFIETTLYCPWYFVAGDYNAFSLIRNTGNTSLAGVVVTWRGLSGSVAGTTTVAIPANGTVILNARDFVSPGVFPNGSVEIAHAGSPDQLQGSTTTLSGTTGLGFDALFVQRKTW